MSIQGNINKTLTIIGALASQSPELKQQAEARAMTKIETKNFENLQNAIKQIESEYPTASTQEKRQLTNIKKELSKESVGSLKELRGIALKSGDVAGVKKYDELIRQNRPQRLKAKAKITIAQDSLENDQIIKRAQNNALKNSITDKRQDINKIRGESFNG